MSMKSDRLELGFSIIAIHGGLGFRDTGGLGIKNSLLDQCLMSVFGLAHRGLIGGGFYF